jgi:signal transduction histidine kinase/CheY-like chemotaxis protein/ligand-binding sensor domain-containing protein/AraC-like DNA-binding protein
MRYLLIVFIFLSSLPVISSDNEFSFVNYSTSEGLLHKTVICMLMDKDKFLWVGTTRGLSRFDGYGFKNFINDKKNKLSLHGTSINAISEGVDGKIWLSSDVGLEYFDKLTETFHLVDLPGIAGTIFLKNVSIDTNGDIWAYNDSTKLLCLEKSGLRYKYKSIDLSKTIGINGKFEVYRFIVQKGVLFVASNKGIFSYNTQNKTFAFIDKRELKHCFSMQKANDSTFTLTFLFEGVFLLNSNQQTGKWINKKTLKEGEAPNSFSYDATIENDSTLWIATASGLIAMKNNNVKCFNSKSKSSYFDGDLVTCIYKDKDNSVWFGTIENGLYCKKNKSRNFKIASKLYKDDIKKSIVNNLLIFDDNSLLYNDLQALYYCKSSNDLTPDCAKQIFKGTTVSLYPIDGRYCMFSCVDTVFLYDSHSKSIIHKTIVKAAFSACKDSKGIFWIGSWFGILTGVDFEHNKKYSIPIYSPQFTLIGDCDGSLWIGTFGNGLIHITNQTMQNPKIEVFNKMKKSSTNINTNIVHHLYLDSKANLWIGSCGDGLFKYNRNAKTFTNFTIANGLKSNIIESIISDNAGNIWFASKGLTKYDEKKKSFTHFTQSEDIPSCFMAKACSKSPDGRLFFCSSKGIVFFNPHKIKVKTLPSIPVLTGLRIKGIPITTGYSYEGNGFYDKAITYTDKLSIPFAYNSFAIEFACLQFQDSQNLLYEYNLNGIDKGWIPSDATSRIANYSGLQPGSYTFNVRVSNGDGQWSKARSITIIIIPPWWRTWWFWIGLIVFLLFIVTAIIVYRFKLIKSQNIELEELVTERTEELTSLNEQLYKQNDTLHEHQMVIEMKNLELNQVLQAKDELIKIVSHDFKTPLTGIIGVAGLLKNEADGHASDKIKKYANSMLSSASSLVNQMTVVLDWAQSLNKEDRANRTEINIAVLLDDAISLVKENAKQKNIVITKQHEFSSNAFVDPRMISTVFRNLLSNAIKFTHVGGSVHIMIQEIDSGIAVDFIDTGIGIADELLSNLFKYDVTIKRSFGTANEKGTGIGLQLCKSFIDKNDGDIRVKSEVGKGSIFSVTLPKGLTQALIHNQNSTIEMPRSVVQSDNTEMATILIIDDTLEIREVIHSVFEGNYTVLKAEDGNEGLYLAQNMLPDIIISDINMPGISGIEICKALKNNELTSHIPILLITSQQGDAIEKESFDSGANDFIEKPFNPFSLKQKVLALLDYRKHIREEIQKSFEDTDNTYLPLDYDNKIIKKVIDYITENIADNNLNTETVVDNIGVSRAQMWRLFKKTTGKSLGDYIREMRMQKAAEMLKTGKYRVSDVAAEVGFFDAKTFAKNFAKEFGMTPSQYIEMAKKKETNV